MSNLNEYATVVQTTIIIISEKNKKIFIYI